jgi:hypothetical protein
MMFLDCPAYLDEEGLSVFALKSLFGYSGCAWLM